MKDRSIRALTRAALVTLAVMLLASCAVAEAVEVQTADPVYRAEHAVPGYDREGWRQPELLAQP